MRRKSPVVMRQFSSRLRAAERRRLGRLAADRSFWAFRPALHLLVRSAYRWWFIQSDAPAFAKRTALVGAALDVGVAVGLRRNMYPLALRIPLEVAEASLLGAAPRKDDHSAAAMLTVPVLMELTYRGGPQWAVPVALIQITSTTALRRLAGKPALFPVYAFQLFAFTAANQLALLEGESQVALEREAAAAATAALSAAFHSGRYDAAARPLEDDHRIPHDEMAPITGILRRMLSDSVVASEAPSLWQMGFGQRKSSLRGSATLLDDAFRTWRANENRLRPRLSQMVLSPIVEGGKGAEVLLAPAQADDLVEILSSLSLPGGTLEITGIRARRYGDAVSFDVGHGPTRTRRRVTLRPDRVALAGQPANVLRAGPLGAFEFALADALPWGNRVPPGAAVVESLPAAAWLAIARRRDAQGRPLGEQEHTRLAVAVGSSTSLLCAAAVRGFRVSRPHGSAVTAQALLAPAAVVGSAWSLLRLRTRLAVVGATALTVGLGRAIVPRGHRAPLWDHLLGPTVVFGVGWSFDRARVRSVKAARTAAAKEVESVAKAAFALGRRDELEMCFGAWAEAVMLAEHISDDDIRVQVLDRLAGLDRPLRRSHSAADDELAATSSGLGEQSSLFETYRHSVSMG